MMLELAPGVKSWFQRKLREKKIAINSLSPYFYLNKRVYRLNSFSGKGSRDAILEAGALLGGGPLAFWGTHMFLEQVFSRAHI